MDSSMIGKIDKARKYAEEKDRVSIISLKAGFQGDHNTHEVGFDSGIWHCTCHFFSTRAVCGHTMAMQRILDGMLAQKEHSVAAR